MSGLVEKMRADIIASQANDEYPPVLTGEFMDDE